MHFSLFVNLISERKKRNCDVENFNIVQRSLKQNGFIKKGSLNYREWGLGQFVLNFCFVKFEEN